MREARRNPSKTQLENAEEAQRTGIVAAPVTHGRASYSNLICSSAGRTLTHRQHLGPTSADAGKKRRGPVRTLERKKKTVRPEE